MQWIVDGLGKDEMMENLDQGTRVIDKRCPEKNQLNIEFLAVVCIYNTDVSSVSIVGSIPGAELSLSSGSSPRVLYISTHDENDIVFVFILHFPSALIALEASFPVRRC
jgi:hypothetical protein